MIAYPSGVSRAVLLDKSGILRVILSGERGPDVGNLSRCKFKTGEDKFIAR